MEREEQKTRRPRMYKVLLHNDDFTPVEFVVGLVMHVFRKSQDEAARITMDVHMKGVAVAGVYTREIAETKSLLVRSMAEKSGHPLMSSFEPDGDEE